MGKFLVRTTIIFVALYFIASYLFAQFLGVDILTNFYISLFELIMVIYCYSEGKYHCRFLKYTALSIFISDTLTRLDNTFDIFCVTWHNLLPAFILILGIAISCIKALIHFYKVIKLKHKRQ